MGQPAAYRCYFDAQAERYDDYASAGAWTPNLYLADVLTPLSADGPPVVDVLDLGSGTGQTLAVLAQLFPRADLWGVDVSPAMLRRAAAKVPSAQLTTDDLTAYARGLDRDVDLVTVIGCAELVPDLPDALAALRPHVRPGGHVALTIEPLVDGLGVDLAVAAVPNDSPDAERQRFFWTPADVLGSLPGGQLVASRLFHAYERADGPVLNELLLVRLP